MNNPVLLKIGTNDPTINTHNLPTKQSIKRLFPPIKPDQNAIWLAIALTAVLAFIFYGLQPFDIPDLQTPFKYLKLSGLCLSTGLVTFLFQTVVPRYFNNFYDAGSWRSYKSFLHVFWILLVIGFFNGMYTTVVFPNDPVVPSFWESFGATFMIGLLTGPFILYWNYNQFSGQEMPGEHLITQIREPIHDSSFEVSKIIQDIKRFFPPIIPDPNAIWLAIIVSGLLTIIVFGFMPFDLHTIETPYRSLKYWGFCFLTGLVAFVFQKFIPRYFVQWYSIEKWKSYKSLMHTIGILLVTACLYYLYALIVFPDRPLGLSFFEIITRTLIVGLVTGPFILLWNFIQFSHLSDPFLEESSTRFAKPIKEEIVEPEVRKPVGRSLIGGWNLPLWNRIGIALIAGVIVNFVLFIYRPFGIDLIIGESSFFPMMGIGLMVSLVVYVFEYIIPLVFMEFYKRYEWSTWLIVGHISSSIFCAGVLSWIYLKFLYPSEPAIPTLFRTIHYAWVLGIFPALALLAWNYIAHLRYAQSSPFLEQPYRDTPIETSDISKESTEELFHETRKSDILLSSAMGNYMRLYYQSEKGIAKKIIRSTLIEVAEHLEESYFLQCHRSHIVNMNYVVTYSGNSKGMQLKLKGFDSIVHVSRKHTSQVKSWLEANDIPSVKNLEEV